MMRIHFNPGQALPYILVMILVLVISWTMILNISKMLTDRMTLQIAADNAALSAATNQARTLNLLAKTNEMIARTLYDGSFLLPVLGLGAVHPVGLMGIGGGGYASCVIAPLIPQCIMDNVSCEASTLDVILGVRACSFGTRPFFMQRISAGATAMRAQVDALITFQENIVARVGPWETARVSEEVGRRHNKDIKVITTHPLLAGVEEAGVDLGDLNEISGMHFRALGLQRNKTKNNEILINYYGAEHIGFSIPPNPFVPACHLHFVFPYKLPGKGGQKAWYYADANTFHRKKLTIKATLAANAHANKGFPILGKWTGIEWPKITTLASAAYYNKAQNAPGPGFIVKQKPYRGENIRENIDAYRDSKYDGWYAQLVPVGYILQH